MFNALCYHYKMSNADVGNLTLHQFNSKVEFLNKMFSENKSDTNDNSASNPVNRGILDSAFGVK